MHRPRGGGRQVVGGRAGGRWCTDGESNPSPIFACRVPVRYSDHRVQHPPPVGISPVHVHVPCVCWVGVLRKFYDPHPTAPPALPFRHVCAIGVCSTLSRVSVSHMDIHACTIWSSLEQRSARYTSPLHTPPHTHTHTCLQPVPRPSLAQIVFLLHHW